MIKALYEDLKTAREPRAELIDIRQELKNGEARNELKELLGEDFHLFTGLLRHSDPKVRKNAALILGVLEAKPAVGALYEAYQNETQMFLRSSYLKALGGVDYSPFVQELQVRRRELEAYRPAQEEQKHVQEEREELRKLLKDGSVRKKHRFTGYDKAYEVILTTGPLWQEVTQRQIMDKKTACLKNGVRAVTANIRELQKIPTYRELLFTLNERSIEAAPAQAAEGLLKSNLMELLAKAHGTEGTDQEPFYFRLGIHSRMPLDKRSAFAKKCAFALERGSGRRLCNSTSDYEIEIRLMEKKDGTFLPLVKLFTLKDERFSYRKNTVAASIRPQQAAVAAALAAPYLREEAQVLDPFCGVGTMLLERDRICPARVMYGIDIFGEAISKARENTRLAGRKINYINRDFFQFTHEYLFDEVITDMPDRGKKTKEEQDMLYQKFFQKAGELMKKHGIIILYSNEKSFVKKQLRLQTEFTMMQEYPMDEKEMYNLFIIEKRG